MNIIFTPIEDLDDHQLRTHLADHHGLTVPPEFTTADLNRLHDVAPDRGPAHQHSPAGQLTPDVQASRLAESLTVPLSELQAGWNGHDSDPISHPAITAARRLISSITAIPRVRGGIDISFLDENISIEIDHYGRISAFHIETADADALLVART